MHRWLLIVLVLLLPLRGLAGVAMAGQMLEHRAPTTTSQSTSHHAMAAHQHARMADCDHHGHAEAQAHPHHHAAADIAAGDAQPAGDCPTCASCQVCSSVAVTGWTPVPVSDQLAQAPPALAQKPYPSAEPLLAFKPPRA